MGLDMYLYRSNYVQQWDHNPEETKTKVSFENNPLNIDPKRITYIIEQIGYWRKANAIHAWIVENCAGGVDECQEIPLSREKLEELKSLCERVLADHSLAPDLLPTASGFFFGSTDYDEYYFEDIEDTVKILTEALEGEDIWASSVYYRASW